MRVLKIPNSLKGDILQLRFNMQSLANSTSSFWANIPKEMLNNFVFLGNLIKVFPRCFREKHRLSPELSVIIIDEFISNSQKLNSIGESFYQRSYQNCQEVCAYFDFVRLKVFPTRNDLIEKAPLHIFAEFCIVDRI